MKHPNIGPRGRPFRLIAGLFVLAGLIGLASRAGGFADKLPSDPVEAFHKALQLEKADSLVARLEGKARENALAFRKKNLERAAAQLTSLGDIAQALLLPSWPIEDTSEYDQAARDIDNTVRQELVKRFMTGVRRVLRGDDPPRQAAVAILLGETALTSSTDLERRPVDKADKARRMLEAGRETLFREMSALTPELAALTASPAPQVRGAAARALGQFSLRPRAATAGLERVLATDQYYVGNRRAAADSLVSMVQTVAGTEPALSSEPGIMSRETRRSKRLFAPKDRIAVWSAVTPVAARGLSDPDVKVRRSSVAALQQATAALALEIFFAVRDPDLKSFPPRERTDLAPSERRRILEDGYQGKNYEEGGYQGLIAIEKQLAPAIRALTRTPKRGEGVSVRDALVRAAADPDVEVRLGVRRTFEEMARARRFLIDLRDSLPPLKSLKDGKDPEKLDLPKDKGKDDDLDKDKKKDKGKDKGKKDDDLDKDKKKDKGKDDDLDKDKKDKGKKDDLSWRDGRSGLQLVSAQAPLLNPARLSQKKEDNKPGEKLDPPKGGNNKPKGKNAPDNRAKNVEEEDPYKDEPVDPDALGKTLVGIGEDVIRRGAFDSNPAGRRASLEAIESMGETGKVFLPQLIAALKDPDKFVRWIASRTLGRLAPAGARDALAGLICLLDEVDLDVRLAAIDAITSYGSAAASAVPELARRVNKGDAESRIAMMRALEAIGAEAASALPELKPLLINLDPRLRAEAARVLGQFRGLARDFLPDLQRLLRDPDSEVRRTASAAIIFITDDAKNGKEYGKKGAGEKKEGKGKEEMKDKDEKEK